MSEHRWRSMASAVMSAVLAASLSPGIAHAGTVDSAPTPSLPPVAGTSGTPSAPAPAGQGGAGGVKVTLITGDVATFVEGADGTSQVRVGETDSSAGVSYTEQREGTSHYVFPSTAKALIAAGTVDKSLFDVAYLARNGYGDAQMADLPVIVQYPKATRPDAGALSRKADALPGTPSSRGLAVADAAAVKVAKSQASDFWNTLAAPAKARTTALAAGATKLWLDRKVYPAVDRSAEQIGAPQAWAAGLDGKGVTVAVLDTGIDATHPDIAGKIVAAESFFPGEAVADGHGHGTHVAATILGSGQASGGKYRGVAPGASLMVGKVLNNSGYGYDSTVIDGMTWAAENGADVVNLSLGSPQGTASNPQTDALNELSARHDVLFVVAAGNSGPGPFQVGSPGSAAAALTVAAVDRQDAMAPFSSRGPLFRDYGLKPEISAPGVGIVAARAAGTSMGTPVDGHYTAASGTSMATPHVAAAAAILAQQHPDWSAQRLKSVLVATAKDLGAAVNGQGAGRVDLARATTQQVYATPGVDFGGVAHPYSERLTKTVTYTNDGTTAVTLNLTSRAAALRGTTPDGVFTVHPTTVTVPAGGTADVSVTFDATMGGEATWFGGLIHAVDAAAGVEVNVPVGARKQPRQVKLSMKIIPPDGAVEVVPGGFYLARFDDTGDDLPGLYSVPPVLSRDGLIDAGRYGVTSSVEWWDRDGTRNAAVVANPNVDATRDVTVTFDLRKAQQLRVDTPRPGVPYYQAAYVGLSTKRYARGFMVGHATRWPYSTGQLWTLPNQTGGPADGALFVSNHAFLIGPQPVTMSIGRRQDLHPTYATVDAAVPMFDGNHRLDVVDAGHGLPTDLAGVDVRGKLALIDVSDICVDDVRACADAAPQRVRDVTAAGAAGVLGFTGRKRLFLDSEIPSVARKWTGFTIPTMSLPASEGRALRDRLAQGPVSVDIIGVANASYVYPLSFTGYGKVPDPHQKVTARNLVEIENRYHVDGGQPGVALASWRPLPIGGWPASSFRALSYSRHGAGTLTSYVGPVGAENAWDQAAGYRIAATGATAYAGGRADVYTRPQKIVRDWGQQPLVPSAPPASLAATDHTWQFCMGCRTGDVLDTSFAVGASGATSGGTAVTKASQVQLYKDGVPLPVHDGTGLWWAPMKFFVLPPERANYRLDVHVDAPAGQPYARASDTSWTFASERRDDGYFDDYMKQHGLFCYGWWATTADHPADHSKPCNPLELLYVGYDLNLASDNTAPAGRTHRFTIAPYYNDLLAQQPKVTSLKVWLTYDDGRTWQQAPVHRTGGQHQVLARHPALRDTVGAVGIRVEAVDSRGNTVKQTVQRAYGLS